MSSPEAAMTRAKDRALAGDIYGAVRLMTGEASVGREQAMAVIEDWRRAAAAPSGANTPGSDV